MNNDTKLNSEKSFLKISTFIVDITPPVGFPLAFNINEKVGSPIYVRGVVLDDSRTRAVLVSSDIILIYGKAHKQWQEMIAKAAGTSADKVFCTLFIRMTACSFSLS